MQLNFIGCGDAFGSGGRFNTCFHITGAGTNFLVDCGATSLVAMKRAGVRLNEIRTILITHFHADHFGGIPPFVLDAQFFSKRQEPLTIAGPHELALHFERAMEIAYPGSAGAKRRFDVRLVELADKTTTQVDGLTVTPFLVNHGSPGGPFFAYRIEAGGRTLSYTGDTEWVDCLVEAGRDADLFVAEAYFRDRKVPLHLDLATLETHLADINPRQLILTHMSDDMLGHCATVPYTCAEDGMIVSF